ncbi:serine hydrolase domain-containing protein [Lihuaxuella thermophila]|uniref:CubicO group peptidase, beta-lactamase class C family n=1 Tax=Lihuaxuella thermophila TaxID=1173111 RepID=A0A1H8BF26_9BACL|nr:serine hydrolase domain-containing protein [Lihuaxuella thermophila]SEM81412.1 CubicO group peptidase, beta-lactamase class C family [Lihuaxuella thermophila]
MKKMPSLLLKGIIFVLVTSFICSWSLPVYAQTPRSEKTLTDVKEFEAFLDRFMNQKLREKNIAGASFVLVKDGRIFIAKGYGYADLEKKQPVDPDTTIFRVASISKLFTTTAVMQQVERGKLDLHTDLNQYLTGTYLHTPFAKPVTIHHLLTHTAGFLNETSMNVSVRDPKKVKSPYTVDSPVLEPGKMISYSNAGMEWAGRLVQESSGMPFNQYMKKNIFEPLGMKRSTFSQDLPEEWRDHLATAYRFKNGKNVPQPYSYFHGGPSASLHTTATDVARFMIAHLQRGTFRNNRILEEKTVALMHRTQFRHHPKVPGMAYGFFEEEMNGDRALFHEGRLPEGTSLLYLLPQENTGFFITYNRNPVEEKGKPVTQQLKDEIMNRYFPGKASAVRDVQPDDFEKYEGVYRWEWYPHHTMEKIVSLFTQIHVQKNKQGHLELKSIAHPPSLLTYAEPGVFQTNEGKKLGFQSNSSGEMTFFYEEGNMAAYQKVKWYETDVFHFALLGLFAFTFLLAIGYSLFDLVKYLLRKRGKWIFSVIIGITGAGNLLFLAGCAFLVIIPYFTTYWAAFHFGIPWTVKWISVLPWVSGVLSIGLLIETMMGWKKQRLSTGRGIYYLVTAVMTLAFIGYGWYWNLIWLSY